ncbi:MAG: glycosyltransferase family 39 protein [Bacteroidales bacterium]|nr:glycosyltransferase family 39 protein [Bacteroidales bacterium]
MKIKESEINKYLIILLSVSAIIRGFLASIIELGNDEVYYWTYALYPDWSHFDHPPMVGWFIQLFSCNLLFSSEFFLRLSSVISMTINTYLIFLIGKQVKNAQTGFYAAMLYTASVYAFVITGIFILPDTPLSIFSLLAILQFIKYFQDNKNKHLLLAGLLTGLAMLSKYSGVFIWVGVGLYVIFYSRKEFKNPFMCLSIFISAICILPILIWNINNEFISFTFHSDRVGVTGKLHLEYFLTELIGEIIYNNPINYILIIIALVALFKGKDYISETPKRLILCLSLPLIITFWFFSLTKEILPHWTSPSFILLLIFVASQLSDKHEIKDNYLIIPKSITISISLLLITLFIGVIEIQTGFIPLRFTEKSKTIQRYGEGDFTLDMYGRKQIKDEFQQVRENTIKEGTMKENDGMIALKWFPLANFDYYVASPLGINMYGFSTPADIHKYAWINKERGDLKIGDDYWFLTESSDYYEPNRYLKPYFEEINPIDTITIERCGKPSKYVFIYTLKNLKKVPMTWFEENDSENVK